MSRRGDRAWQVAAVIAALGLALIISGEVPRHRDDHQDETLGGDPGSKERCVPVAR
jgi:hypothetical protein